MLNNLKEWGVEVGELPTAVAEKYLADISVATEFETYTEDSATGAEFSYKKGDLVLAKEGAYKVKETLNSLIDTLLANIKESYVAEIDAAKSLADAETKSVAKSVVFNAITNWVADNEDATISEYVSTADGGLIAAIENAISTYYGPSGNQPNSSFINERIVNESKKAKEALQAKATEIKTADADYAKAISFAKQSSGDFKGKYKINYEIGLEGYTVTNPFAGTVTAETKDGEVVAYYSSSDILETYSVDKVVANAFDKNGKALQGNTGVTVNSPLNIKKWTEAKLGEITTAYNNAKDEYQTAHFAKLENTNTRITFSSSWEAGVYTLETLWNASFDTPSADYSFVDVSNARKGYSSSEDLLFGASGIIDSMKEFVRYIEATDPTYKDKVYTVDEVESNVSAVKVLYTNTYLGILLGSVTDVSGFEAALYDAYQSDVEAYATTLKDQLNTSTNNKIEESNSVEVINGLKNRLATATAVYGDGTKYSSKGTSFNISTIGAADQWYEEAKSYVFSSIKTTNSDLAWVDTSYTPVHTLLKQREAQLNAVESGTGLIWTNERGQWTKDIPSSATPNEEYEISIIKDSSTSPLVYEYPEIASELDLHGDFNDNGVFVYKITGVEDVNNWFNDALKVKSFLEEYQYSNLTTLYEAKNNLLAHLDSFVGKKLGTEAVELTAEDIKTDVVEFLNTWLRTPIDNTKVTVNVDSADVITSVAIDETVMQYGEWIAGFNQTSYNIVSKGTTPVTYKMVLSEGRADFAEAFAKGLEAITGLKAA